jgi:hypothetical protein
MRSGGARDGAKTALRQWSMDSGIAEAFSAPMLRGRESSCLQADGELRSPNSPPMAKCVSAEGLSRRLQRDRP